MLAPSTSHPLTTVKYYGSKLGNEFATLPLPYCGNIGTPSGLRYAPPLGVGYAVGFDGSTARVHFEGVTAGAKMRARQSPPLVAPLAPLVLRSFTLRRKFHVLRPCGANND